MTPTLDALRTDRDDTTDTFTRRALSGIVDLVEFQRALYGDGFVTVTHLADGSALVVEG